MRLGIITDIHNNLPALKTVVEYLEKQRCDKIICCGDIIGIGEVSGRNCTVYK